MNFRLLAVFLVAALLPACADDALKAPDSVKTESGGMGTSIIMFGSNVCPSCEKARKYIDTRPSVSGVAIRLEYHDLDEAGVHEKLLACMRAWNVSNMMVGSGPIMFIGSSVVTGFSKSDLDDAIAGYRESDHAERIARIGTVAAPGAEGGGETPVHPAAIMLAGFADGINPCSFSIILYLFSICALSMKEMRRASITAVAFIAGIFMFYFFAGSAFSFALLRLSSSIRPIRLAIRAAGVGLSFIFAAKSVVDAVRMRKGIEISRAAVERTRRMHAISRRAAGVEGAGTVLAGVLGGVAVGVLELGCSGQLYIPTIAYMLGNGSGFAVAWGYLLLYNVAFIAPIAVLSASMMAGIATKSLRRILQGFAARPAGKLIQSITLCAIGIMLIFD